MGVYGDAAAIVKLQDDLHAARAAPHNGGGKHVKPYHASHIVGEYRDGTTSDRRGTAEE